MAVERAIGERMKEQTKLSYAGALIISIVFFLIKGGQLDIFLFVKWECLLLFGYIASIIDIKSKCVPNQLVIGMILTWFFILMWRLFFDENVLVFLKDAVLGFIIGGGLFLFVYVISRRGLGGGDVKFMAAVGLYTGFAETLSVMLYGTMLAALAGIILLLLKKISRKDAIPLIPFLYLGILITIFFR